MRPCVRRGLLALCIGFGIKVLLLIVEALTRTPSIPGHSPSHSLFWFLHFPGFIVQILAQTIVPIMWSLHPIALQVLSISADVLCYSAIAYLVLRLRSDRNASERNAISVEPGEPVQAATAQRHQVRFTRRIALALGIGLAVAATSVALQQIMLTRAIPNGTETLPIDQAYPVLMNVEFPGVVFLILALNLTPVMWGSHPVAARAVVATGNFLFYSFVAYVLLRVAASLSAKWRRQ